MNASKTWSIELARLTLIILAALLFSLLLANIWLSLALFLSFYIAWHLINLSRLFKWFSNNQESPPQSSGIWGEVFDHLFKLQQRGKADKRRLQRQMDRFEESATALPDGTVILNKKDVIEWCNEAAERLLGLRRKYDYGQRVDNLIRNPVFIEYLNGVDYENVIEIPAPIESNIILRIRLVPYGNKQKLLLARNVTRLYNLELIRRDFIANVSHELRTPLTVIMGFLENMQNNGYEHAGDWQRPVQLMQEQSARMLRIIDDLLFLSKLETETTSRKKEIVKVPGILATVREDAINFSGIYKHKIIANIDHSLLLKGNYNELFSAFSNLVINAVKYTPQAGTITMNWFEEDESAVFEVRDNGIGIATPHLSRLTERFYRVDVGRSREQGGTGLGLAIVKHVLIRHNARLEIESEIDKGSTFRCVFPQSLIAHQQNTMKLS